MVQRKVSYKLSIQPKTTLKTEHNHDDVKAMKIKKSRHMKRSTDLDLEFKGFVTPIKAPNPKKTVSCNNSAPNYMKSTNSSELHKVRSLTKSPSFKHTRTTGSRKKTVVCDSVDAQRATCSSTLKEYMFPSYLTLMAGATEAEGTSVMKVCPYTYCSLNGHRHGSAAPPLKTFLASRRNVVKAQKTAVVSATCKQKRPENKLAEDAFFVEIHVPGYSSTEESPVVSARKEGSSEWDYDNKSDHITGYNPVEESPVSIAGKEGSLEWDYNNASDVEMDSDSSVSLDQLFGEVSDMEWEEGYNTVASDDEKVYVSGQKDCGGDEIKPGFEVEKVTDGKLLSYIYDEMIMECFQFSDTDTVSDSESSQTDGDYIVEKIVHDETNCTAKIEEESIEGSDGTISKLIEETPNEGLDSSEEHNEANGDELNQEMYLLEHTRDGNISDIIMDETKSGEISLQDLPWEARSSENNDANEEIPLTGNNCQSAVEQSEAENMDDESPLNSDNSQSEVDQIEADNTEDESLGIFNECPQPTDEENLSSVKDVVNTVIKAGSRTGSSEEYDSNQVKLESIDFILAEEVKESEIEDISSAEEEAALPIIVNKAVKLRKGVSDTGHGSINEIEECSTKLKKTARRNKTEEDGEDDRDFNPRPPNFLPVEPEPEPEKVDLKHQDMEKRKDAQDWMLDHALQKTVNQLGNARKRKVSLLVEAFEAVLPVPKYEPHMRRNLSGLVQTRPVQACR